MIRSEIQQLDTLISSLQTVTNVGESAYLETVAEQCDSVKQQWLKKLFSSVSETVLVRYVHYHQAAVTALSDRVWRDLKLPKTKKELSIVVVSRLEELIDFLKDSFFHYFDKRHPMSLARWQNIAAEVTTRLEQTIQSLEQARVAASLIAVVRQAIFDKLQEGSHHSLSFQQADNMFNILQKLTDLANEAKTPTTLSIAQDLHRQNFNSYHFTGWHQDYLAGLLQHITEQEKATIISREIILLESIHADPDKAFDADLPASTEQVVRAIKKLAPALHDPLAGNTKAGAERLPLFYSVPQFAFFVRLCYLEGCFPVQNVSAIFRFFTSHFETKKQPNISVKSFGRAFYSTDQGTAAIVRDLLQRMINFINKTYFP